MKNNSLNSPRHHIKSLEQNQVTVPAVIIHIIQPASGKVSEVFNEQSGSPGAEMFVCVGVSSELNCSSFVYYRFSSREQMWGGQVQTVTSVLH